MAFFRRGFRTLRGSEVPNFKQEGRRNTQMNSGIKFASVVLGCIFLRVRIVGVGAVRDKEEDRHEVSIENSVALATVATLFGKTGIPGARRPRRRNPILSSWATTSACETSVPTIAALWPAGRRISTRWLKRACCSPTITLVLLAGKRSEPQRGPGGRAPVCYF
jgi:hypothetical protein